MPAGTQRKGAIAPQFDSGWPLGQPDLVLRAAVLPGRWEETMERGRAAMAKDRRRDCQWKAPDIEAELNSGLPIKPPSPQPDCVEQAEAIAA